jgi:hypothetical protein
MTARELHGVVVQSGTKHAGEERRWDRCDVDDGGRIQPIRR